MFWFASEANKHIPKWKSTRFKFTENDMNISNRCGFSVEATILQTYSLLRYIFFLSSNESLKVNQAFQKSAYSVSIATGVSEKRFR